MNSNKITNLTTPTVAADAATKSYVDTSIPIGGIIMWSGATGTTLPSNWKLCDGSTHSGITTPDLRGRFVLSSTTPTSANGGIALGAGLSTRAVDGTGGAERVSLTISQMPRHSRTYNSKFGSGQIAGTPDHWPGVDNVKLGQWNTGMRGGVAGEVDGIDGASHENMPPFYVLAFIMRVS